MIYIKLTNGFGNNIFQYVAARQLAEFHNCELYAIPPSDDYYAINDLISLGVNFLDHRVHEKPYEVNENNYRKAFNKTLRTRPLIVSGYFEDYTLYEKNFHNIKSWFPKAKVRQDNDLVLHFRGGDRLFYKNGFGSKPSVDSFLNAINKFDFNKLHVVTDMPFWRHASNLELSKTKFHYDAPANIRVDIRESTEYFNSIVDGLSSFEPIVKHGSVGEDFNYIRTFKNILFEHGTLSWWASVLSDADKVGVYGPWRPWKGASNKNLSSVPIKGWFKWK